MTVHVGIDACDGKLSYYNGAQKEIVDLEIVKVYQNETAKVNLMFNEIISKIDGKLGCACICLDFAYDNKIRKKFIEEGLKFGFENVEIINRETAIYISAMSQMHYKPLNDDVIWIYFGISFFVWKIEDRKAKYIGQWEANNFELKVLQSIMDQSKLNKGPDIVLHENLKFFCEIYFKELIPDCKIFTFKFGYFSYYLSKGSLVKARITAGDRDVDVLHLNALNFLRDKFILKLGENDITSFEENQQLPINYSTILKRESNSGELLKVIRCITIDEEFELPNFPYIYLTFQIDKSLIYSVTFEERTETG